MILLLQNDTSKEHPVGFENLRCNIFDPEEDPIPAVVKDHKSVSMLSRDNMDDDSDTEKAAAVIVTEMELNPVSEW